MKMCEKMSFVVGLLIGIVAFSSASKGGLYIHAMGDEKYDMIKISSLVILIYQ